MDHATKTAIIDGIVEMIVETLPDASMRPMYGGIVIEMIAGDPKTRVAGYFEYSEHISVEFSEGASFDDPNGFLEGSGKWRRHIKIYSLTDLVKKDCRGFLRQTLRDQ